MCFKFIRTLLFVAVLLGCYSPVYAQKPQTPGVAATSETEHGVHVAGIIDGDSGVAVVAPGVFLEAKDTFYLRDSPPQGLFFRQGEQIGTLKEGQKVIADDQKMVNTIFGDYLWLRVRLLNEKGKPTGQPGWVYAGQGEEDSRFNVLKVAAETKTAL
jgi:hypothetical protein